MKDSKTAVYGNSPDYKEEQYKQALSRKVMASDSDRHSYQDSKENAEDVD